MKEETSKWDRFWRSFNPPLPDVVQARMLSTLHSKRPRLVRVVRAPMQLWAQIDLDASYGVRA